MNVEINKPELKLQTNFPIYAKSLESELLVLFSDENSGVVVNGAQAYYTADYTKSWKSVFNKKEWEILPIGSTITIEI